MQFKQLLITTLLTTIPLPALAQTTTPTSNAADLYMQAAKIVRADDDKNIMAPSASNENFPHEYPPISDKWIQMEKQDYDPHAQVRQLVHEAGLLPQANWPVVDPNQQGLNRYHALNESRNIANEIGDGAKYQSLILHDQPAAFQSADDLLRLSEHLKNSTGENLVYLLVGEGIDALDSSRLMVIIANAKITTDPTNTTDLPLATATRWIARLLDHPAAQAELDQALKNEPPNAAANPILQTSLTRILETIHRVQTERDFAAMSLAAHVYQFKHNNWPANLDELKTELPPELPRLPIDPWSNGQQTLGYTLIPNGLPNNTDRPLLYSRNKSKDGLFFRTDQPAYSYYASIDPAHVPPNKRKQGGQFRDVAPWPTTETKLPPTTRPLDNPPG